MQYRTLGLRAIQVSAITLGCWPFAAPASWGPQDEAASVATVHSEIDAGITSIDNAAGYGGGQAEPHGRPAVSNQKITRRVGRPLAGDLMGMRAYIECQNAVSNSALAKFSIPTNWLNPRTL